MNIAQIIALARQEAGGVTTNEVSDASLLTFANKRYHQIENAVTSRVNEDFFYQEWTTDTVQGQREYPMPAKSGTTPGAKKVLEVSVIEKAGAQYLKYDTYRGTDASLALTRYESGNCEKFATIADNSLFLYPTPTESVTGGLRLYGTAMLGDIELSTPETGVKIPLETHEVMAIGLAADIMAFRSLWGEKSQKEAEYEKELDRVVYYLSDRVSSPLVAIQPDTSHLT